MKDNVIIPLATRGNGDIYLGVVGAVRTGKSTFIKKVIENLIVPNIEDETLKKIATISNGDVRTALNALEIATLTTEMNSNGEIEIDDEVIKNSRKLLYIELELNKSLFFYRNGRFQQKERSCS